MTFQHSQFKTFYTKAIKKAIKNVFLTIHLDFMISILIPTYNYQITALVSEVHRQFTESEVAFEMICLEDGSDKNYVASNLKIEKLINTTLLISNENLGRIKARQHLCEAANHNWLLFLDADVMPKTATFSTVYIDELISQVDAVFGGICYKKDKPQKDYMLRWKYGTLNEENSAEDRQEKAYKSIASANMLIRKDLFDSINSTIAYTKYGMDNYFGAKLKEYHSTVKHINNPVYHLGIETSSHYLEKKEEAADTLLYLLNTHAISDHDNKLLSLFLNLKRYKLNYIVSFLFRTFKQVMRKNLLSKNPSIILLQFYRISYMCYKDLKPNT